MLNSIIPLSIKKRGGEIVPFEPVKIRNVMHKASIATGDEISMAKLDELTRNVVFKLPMGQIPTVEQVQDVVEEVLIEAGYSKTAKAFILYRAEHSKIRQSEADLMEIYNQLTFTKADDADIKRENANIDADSSMGTMLKYGSEGSKYYVDNYILPKDIAAAHINGDIHIHDKDFYMLTETCCQIDINKLFKNGFSTGHGYLREPQNIQSYSALACIAIQANQNEMHGGQSIPNFDNAMAPGVAKSYRKQYFKALAHSLSMKCGIKYSEISAALSRINKEIGEEFRMGREDEFFGKLAEAVAPMLAEKGAQPLQEDVLRSVHEAAAEFALTETDNDTYQAMQALVHNLNTMNSRAGAQVPFSSLNYGTDTTLEGRMVIKNLLLATDDGLGFGETPIFPVQIFKVKEGINYNEGDPNYDLFKLAIKTSAKRLFPNFSFLDAPFNLQYYRPGDFNSEVAYMGCRTRVMANVYDRGHETTFGRGNLSFTSINLPRIGIEAQGDVNKLYRMLDERMELVFRQLLHRFKIQSQRRARNYPFLMGEGVWLDSETLDKDDTIGEILKHGTLSIGFIGLAETLVALTGKHHGEDENSRRLGYEIISYMRKKCDEQSAATGLNFTLLATPAEGLSGRFVRIDRAHYGKIEGVTDREYYTNSFHVPVYYPIRAMDKIKIEAPYHALTNAGHISYVELDGDVCKNLDAFETIIRYMKQCGIGYGSVNHPVDRDPVCGYTGVIDNECPRCGRPDGQGAKFERIRRITGYLVGTTDRFNNAKRAEERDRVKHGI